MQDSHCGQVTKQEGFESLNMQSFANKYLEYPAAVSPNIIWDFTLIILTLAVLYNVFSCFSDCPLI